MDIKRLKDKILQLAIQGRLVEQNDNDEPVEILIKEIEQERQNLIKKKKIKNEKLEDIKLEECNFDIPQTWKRCRLGKLILLISGRDVSLNLCNDQMLGVPYIMGASNMTTNGVKIERWIESPTVIGEREDIMISVKGTVGKLSIIDFKQVHLSRQVMSLRCFKGIYNKYLLIFLSFYMEELQKSSTGVIPGISREDILNILVPVPPEKEQKRIVDKVQDLFKLIDELNNNKQDLLKNIVDSRNKVIQLAIQGKLVEQMEEEESVLNLLDRISEGKSLNKVKDEEKIYDIPITWMWVKLKDICQKFKYGSSAKSKEKGEVPVLRMGNIQSGKIDWRNLVYTSDEVEINKYDLVKGDLLFNRTNSPELVGKTAIYKGEHTAIYAGYLIRVRTLEGINSEYINLFMNSQTAKDRCREVKTDGVSQSNINAEKLGDFNIPLPSTNEQKRIVEKVNIIMDYLDALEKEIES